MFTAVSIRKRARSYPRMVYPQRGRPYMSSRMSEYNSNTRIYVWPKGESILENLENRHSRPRVEWKREILRLFPELVGKLRWSQYAGCSCPCSPGFIVNERLRDEQGNPIDIHIDVAPTAVVRLMGMSISSFCRQLAAMGEPSKPSEDTSWLELVGAAEPEEAAPQPTAIDRALQRAGYNGTDLLSAA